METEPRPTLTVRRLVPGDAEPLWTLRLQGLRESPLAFSGSPDEDGQVPLSDVRERLKATESRVLGAFEGGALVGIMGLRRERAMKRRHLAHLWGVYVAPDARGRGVGKALLAAVTAEARAMEGVLQIHLSVSTRTPAARRLYEREGYQAVGLEPRALAHDGELIDDVLMVRFLDDDKGEVAPVTFEGGCHCKRVRFRVTTTSLRALDCNCSVCAMKGFLHLIVPESAFALLSGEGDLAVYTFNTGVAKHMFCKSCGMHPFYRPRSHPDAWDVNVRCLDGDARQRFAVVPFDGQRWEENVASIQ